MIFLLLLGSGQTVFAQATSPEIDKLVRTLNARGQFEGSVLVARNGRVIYRAGFGDADVSKHLAFNPDLPTYLASLSKQFTAMAIMMLAETHLLAYSDPLSKYFPEFPPYAQSVTLRHLLNHTSGIIDYVDLGLEKPGLTNDEVLRALVRQPKLRFNPGEKFEYSNSGYVLLGLIIEKVSGQPYSTFLQQHIFGPLKMRHTFVYGPARSKSVRARAYNRFGDPSDYDLLTYGEGGIYSTVDDLAKWDRALYTEKLVKQFTLQEALTPGRLNDGSFTNYGFGWGIGAYAGQPTYGHAGRYGGFNTYIKRFMKDGSVIIFLTNHDFKDIGAIGNALTSALNGEKYTLPKRSIAELMYQEFQQRGISAAIDLYRSAKQRNPEECNFSEGELNELGYELLGRQQTSDAIAILKLNAEAFPSSANVYDSLGEAYFKNGDRELAIQNYQKSLELNPNNSNAEAMLKKLRGL